MEAGLYVGIQSTFVNTGYGSGFFPGRHIVVIDLITNGVAAIIDLGDTGPNGRSRIPPPASA